MSSVTPTQTTDPAATLALLEAALPGSTAPGQWVWPDSRMCAEADVRPDGTVDLRVEGLSVGVAAAVLRVLPAPR